MTSFRCCQSPLYAPTATEPVAQRCFGNTHASRPLWKRFCDATQGEFDRVVSVGKAIGPQIKRLFQRPAKSETFRQRTWGYSYALRPFRFRKRLAVKRDLCIASGVAVLCVSRGPNAIFWRVRTIVVGSFQRVLGRWASAHVLNKRGKAVPPSGAHANSAFPVTNKTLGIRIVAAIPRGLPHRVFWRVRHSMRADLFNAKAAAACGVGLRKRGCSDAQFVAAIASTEPRAIAADMAVLPQRHKSAKTISGKINRRWHEVLLYAGFRSKNYLSGLMSKVIGAASIELVIESA